MIYLLFILIKISIGKSEKKAFYEQSMKTPGPNYYNNNNDKENNNNNIIKKELNKGFKFSIDGRIKDLRSTTPGPGNYNIDSNIGKGDAYKFSMGIKLISKINLPPNYPGPGAYNMNDISKPNSKSFTISNLSPSKNNKKMIPGPGHYSPEKKTNNPKWTMGSKSHSTSIIGRLKKLQEGNPAPGNYEISKSKEGPKVKIK